MKFVLSVLMFGLSGCALIENRDQEMRDHLRNANASYALFVECSDHNMIEMSDKGEDSASAILEAHNMCKRHYLDHELATYRMYSISNRDPLVAKIKTKMDLEETQREYRASRLRLLEKRKSQPAPASI